MMKTGDKVNIPGNPIVFTITGCEAGDPFRICVEGEHNGKKIQRVVRADLLLSVEPDSIDRSGEPVPGHQPSYY
jgi:hypothetical protein